jgi:hypothetical protein
MDIRFVSTLTPEDEDRLAPGLVNAIGQLLDALPLAYTLRVETSNGRIFQHTHAGPDIDAETSGEVVPAPVGPLFGGRPAS